MKTINLVKFAITLVTTVLMLSFSAVAVSKGYTLEEIQQSQAIKPWQWSEVKDSYKEIDLSKQKAGDLLYFPCQEMVTERVFYAHGATPFPEKARCGYLSQPLNHEDPDPSQNVHIFFTVIAPINKSEKEPIVFLTGGPGQNASSSFSVVVAKFNVINIDRALVLVDYRGSGMSVPSLVCLDEMEQYGGNRTNVAKACKDRLAKQGVASLELFNTRQMVADIDALRNKLGFKTWDLYGVSYGTRVALTLIRDYPQGVGSAVLDSVFPIEVSGLADVETPIFSPLDFMIDSCLKSGSCDSGKMQKSITTLLERLVKLSATYRHLSHNTQVLDIFDFLRFMTFSVSIDRTFPTLVANLNALSDKDLSSYIYSMVTPRHSNPKEYFGTDTLVEAPRVSRLFAPNDSFGLWNSVTCREESMKPGQSQYHVRHFSTQLVNKVVAEVTELSEIKYFAVCDAWGVKLDKNPKTHRAVKSNIPTLILNSPMDHFTPLVWAKAVEKNLPNSYLFQIDYGHHSLITANSCAAYTIKKFLDAPIKFISTNKNKPLPATECASLLPPLYFETR